MKLNYSDIAAFIDHIVDNALGEGIEINSLDELYPYLDDNSSNVIEIVEHD